MKTLVAAAFLCASAALIIPAQADDAQGVNLGTQTDPAGDPMSPWFFRVGAAELQNLDGFNVTVAGQAVPDTTLHYNHIYSVLLEAGYNITPEISGVLSVGWPPAISIAGGGSIAPYGKLESTTFGPSALTVQYQPFHDGMIRPYVGAGAAYMIIFSTHGAAVQDPKLSNDLSPEFEVGSDLMFQENLGLFVEMKKAFLTSHATGTIGGYPLDGKANLSPWVYATGLTLHF
jgi:outer membrane protein